MAYIKYRDSVIGKKVTLTSEKGSFDGHFTIGSVVTITDVDDCRGYTFEDEFGNKVIEAGFKGFELIP